MGAIPINVLTNIGSVDTTYRQMGIIKLELQILPLIGCPLFTNRDKLQYYTISKQRNNVKLPILCKGHSSVLNDYEVNQIFDSDSNTIYIKGYNEPF